MKGKLFFFMFLILLFAGTDLCGENGYELWLRYAPVPEPAHYEYISGILDHVMVDLSTPTGSVTEEELQAGNTITGLPISRAPKIKLRLLNHWDNLDRTVERGYAGFSLWK